MDINSRFSQAAVIAAGIAFLGMCINDGIDDFVNKDRVVTVKGLAEGQTSATVSGAGQSYRFVVTVRKNISDGGWL